MVESVSEKSLKSYMKSIENMEIEHSIRYITSPYPVDEDYIGYHYSRVLLYVAWSKAFKNEGLSINNKTFMLCEKALEYHEKTKEQKNDYFNEKQRKRGFVLKDELSPSFWFNGILAGPEYLTESENKFKKEMRLWNNQNFTKN